MSKSGRVWTWGALLVATLVIGGSMSTGAASGAGHAGVASARTCGITPSLGYYNYYRVRNVSCRIAKKVSRAAGKNFCGHRYRNCSVDPGEFKKGHTKAKGWRCKMKVGYEFYRAKCKRRDQRFKHESAA